MPRPNIFVMKQLSACAAVLLLLSGSVLAANTTSGDDLFSVEWSKDLSGEVNYVGAVDLNGDGNDEVATNSLYITSFGRSGTVWGLDGRGQPMWKYLSGLLEDSYTTKSGYTVVGSGPYAALLGPDGRELWKMATRSAPSQGIFSQKVYASDLNGDGKVESLIATNFGRSGAELGIRDSAGAETASLLFKGFETPEAIEVADLEGDGRKEILVGTLKYSPNTVGGTYEPAHSKPTTFSVYDAGGALKWSDSLASAATAVKACDLDKDGRLEVLVGSMGLVNAYSSDGKRQWSAAVDGQVNSLDCGDIGGDGTVDVAVAAGKAVVLKGDGSQLWSYVSGTVGAIRIYDFGGEGSPEVVVGSSSVRVLNGKGDMLYRSGSFGTITSLDIGDLNGGGYMSIVCGSKDHSVRAIGTIRFSQVSAADSYLDLAGKAYSAKDYNLTRYFGTKAMDLYDMAGRDSGKTKAKQLVDKAGTFSSGDTYYNLSYQYFQAGNFADTAVYADKATEEYRKVGNTNRISEMSELKKRADMIPKAADSMRLAREYYSSGDWENASYYAMRARDAYGYLKNDTLVSEAQGISDKSRIYQEFRAQIEAANKCIGASDQENATAHLSLAEKEYLKLNDTRLLPAYQNASDLVGSMKRDSDVIVYGGFGVVALIILLGLAMIVLLGVYFVQKGGLRGLLESIEDKRPKDRPGGGSSGLRQLRGRTGESIGDSFRR
jgi:hypothetical protein